MSVTVTALRLQPLSVQLCNQANSFTLNLRSNTGKKLGLVQKLPITDIWDSF